jgi:pimeloyl-ACP methyl ester carboxylesterase
VTATSEVLAGTATAPDGVPIAYRRWYGERTGAPLVLVHGTSAHAGWWDHVVALLPGRFDVVAVDLGGHGDSGRRPAYDLDSWSHDVLAVVHELFPGEAAVLVGHSVGGLVAAGSAVLDPAAVAATVLVDSIVTDPEPGAVPEWRPPRADRVFGSAEEVVGRFRLTPPQPEADPEVLRALALGSVRPVPGGWSWKVDPLIFAAVGRPGMSGRLPEVPGPVAVVRGELSVLVRPSAGADLAALVGRPVPQFDVPGAHHHLMVDHPAELGEHLARALDAVSPPRSAPEAP